MAGTSVYTLSQVARHNSKKDCWLVINGRVLNVTRLLEEHPGGEEVLIELAGKDATKEFSDIGHSKAATSLLLNYQVGVLQGHTVKQLDQSNSVSPKETQGKEMKAFVITSDSTPKFAAFVDFFFPLLAAVSYFGYGILTRAN